MASQMVQLGLFIFCVGFALVSGKVLTHVDIRLCIRTHKKNLNSVLNLGEIHRR